MHPIDKKDPLSGTRMIADIDRMTLDVPVQVLGLIRDGSVGVDRKYLCQVIPNADGFTGNENGQVIAVRGRMRPMNDAEHDHYVPRDQIKIIRSDGETSPLAMFCKDMRVSQLKLSQLLGLHRTKCRRLLLEPYMGIDVFRRLAYVFGLTPDRVDPEAIIVSDRRLIKAACDWAHDMRKKYASLVVSSDTSSGETSDEVSNNTSSDTSG